MTRQPKPFLPMIILTITLLPIMACVVGTKVLDPMLLTLTPMSASVKGTATARAENAGSGDELATAIAKATEQAGFIYATQTAVGALNEPSRLATATAIAPVVAELPRYGIDPAEGYVAWLHDPATIELQGPNQTGYANEYPQTTAIDFVMAADITWNTKNSIFGCGFMFRSDGNTNKPNQYTVIITRVASGYMAFMAMADGKIANFQTYFPKNEDRSFSWFNDATNRLAVVARGNLLDLYTNGVLIGKVDTTAPPPNSIPNPPTFTLPDNANAQMVQDFQDQSSIFDDSINQINSQLAEARRNYGNQPAIFTDGFLGFIGVSQSGTMTCKFENAWLFIIER
jgi:hypothetical protein